MEHKHNRELVKNARYLRKNMTKEERRLWYDFLRDYPVKFVRQKILGRYIADFYCAATRLVVELDGSQHFEEKNVEQDLKRTEFIEEYGIQVIRISNSDVMENFSGVCEYIDGVVKGEIKPQTTPQSPCGDSSPYTGAP